MVWLQRYPNEKRLPFYKVFKKDRSLGWSKKCQKSFIQIKEHLPSPPILTKLKVRETLFLYIATSDKVMRAMLIFERNGEQKLIYYTNKVLHGIKVRYQKI